MAAEAKTKIEELKKKIEYHSNLYYNEDNPEITDYEFDQMMQELKKLERENPELAKEDSPTKERRRMYEMMLQMEDNPYMLDWNMELQKSW